LKLRAGALALLVACAAPAGCAPELDWRELSAPEGRFTVLLPGKARSESRTLAAASSAVVMTMHGFSLKRGRWGWPTLTTPRRFLPQTAGASK
jgi:hypothetical protein